MKVAAYLGLDIGGTGAKAAVYDGAGHLLGAGRQPYEPSVSPEGHAEIAIERIYTSARDAARQAIHTASVSVRALAIASQGQTFAPLDAEGHSLYPAILWYDSRAVAEAKDLESALRLRLASGESPLVDAIASAPKVLWLRRHFPEQLALAHQYLLLPDYITYRLTGEAVTDPSTASTTGLCAEGEADYNPAALVAAGIARDELARIQQPGTPIACVQRRMAEEWDLGEDTLVVTGTNDQYAGALGAGNCQPGILTETTGTCLALVTLFPEARSLSDAGLLQGRFPVAGLRYALAYAKTAGLVIDWFARQFGAGRPLAELEGLAAASPPGSAGVTVLPHFDGMVSPVPNAASRGAFLNLTLGHTTGDLYRAVLESIAFSLRENMELMQQAGFRFTSRRSIGGGASSDLLMQIKADVTGQPFERPAIHEAATLGAAMLAATGAGEFSDVVECSSTFYRPGQVFIPDTRHHDQYGGPYQAYRHLYSLLFNNSSGETT